MIKKITSDKLKTGMYIHDLNCGWMDHPFLKKSFKIRDDDMITKILDIGIREVFIDTDKGLDDSNAPTEEEAINEIASEMIKVAEKSLADTPRVELKEELVRAKKIHTEAKKTIHNILDDIRCGKQIEQEKVEHAVEKMIYSIFRNQEALVSLCRIRTLDEYTYMHSMSVSVLMLSFGKHLGYDEETLKEVGVGAMLHDIGKMKVPQEILNSPRKLTDEEFAMIKEHASLGEDMLENSEGISRNSVLLAAQHHERYDGSGYPRGLKGDEISKFGQTAAIVDVYDAMTSNRCYQNKREPTDVLRKLYDWGKFHFNIELVQQFIRCIGIYPIGSLVRLESGKIGVVIKHGEQNLLQPVVRAVYNTKTQDYLKTPQDIDLSNGGADRVVDYEVPEKWNIQPEMYL